MKYIIRAIILGSGIILSGLFPASMAMADSYQYGQGHHKYNNHPRNYYEQQRSHRDYRSNCHPVHKYTYDNYGYRAKVGGTMYYDEYGQAYVVPGSRYLIDHD